MMKKILAIIVCLSFIAVFTPTMSALDNDNFSVTASGAYLECNIINASWNIGTVDPSSSYWTNETGETELADTYNCTAGINIDFEMTVSANPVTWTVGNAPAPDVYRINASSDSWIGQEKLELTTYSDVKTNFAPASNASFDLRLDTPTSFSDGLLQTITLNGRVTVH